MNERPVAPTSRVQMNVSSFLTAPVTVLGNAEGPTGPFAASSPCFTFNGRPAPDSTGIQVSLETSVCPDGSPRVRMLGAQPPELKAAIETVLNCGFAQRCEALGCWPSTGYATIHALWTVARTVTVLRVSLDPSLARPATMPMRKPLPQAFHNWLGERRTTFARWLEDPRPDWTWSLVTDPGQPAECEWQSSAGEVHPSEVLEAFNISARSGTLASIEAVACSRVQPSPMLLEASEPIRALEQCFHLDRQRADTRNWWFYDAEASGQVERIATEIRAAQRRAFLEASRQQSSRSVQVR